MTKADSISLKTVIVVTEVLINSLQNVDMVWEIKKTYLCFLFVVVVNRLSFPPPPRLPQGVGLTLDHHEGVLPGLNPLY